MLGQARGLLRGAKLQLKGKVASTMGREMPCRYGRLTVRKAGKTWRSAWQTKRWIRSGTGWNGATKTRIPKQREGSAGRVVGEPPLLHFRRAYAA